MRCNRGILIFLRRYYKGAMGALVVFDITKGLSFRNVEKWISELQEFADQDLIIMLVGNKTDLKDEREILTEEATRFAAKNNLLYTETSALGGENVQNAFLNIVTSKEFF
jgi:small GTP-binding protein